MYQKKLQLNTSKYFTLSLIIFSINIIFSNNEIKIVSLKESDWFKYKEIRLKAVLNCPEAFGTSYDEELKETNEGWIARLKHNMLFAIENGQVVGMIGAVISNSEKKKHRALIISFYIDHNKRKKGIGSMLLDNLINLLKIKYPFLKFLDLCVTTTQTEAINLYQKFGFHIQYCLKEAYNINNKFYDQFFMFKKNYI